MPSLQDGLQPTLHTPCPAEKPLDRSGPGVLPPPVAGRYGGVEHLPVRVHTRQGRPPPTSPTVPPPEAAAAQPSGDLPAPHPGAWGPAGRRFPAPPRRSPLAPRAVPARRRLRPGPPGCPTACHCCPLPVGLRGPGPGSRRDPALGGHVAEGWPEDTCPAPPLRRPMRRTRARSRPSPAPAARPGLTVRPPEAGRSRSPAPRGPRGSRMLPADSAPPSAPQHPRKTTLAQAPTMAPSFQLADS